MRRQHVLFFIVACVLYFIALYPYTMGFLRFYFGDSAWAYSVHVMMREGMTPTVDFAYFYGLSVLLFNKVWFAIFGLTPWALLYLYIAGIVLSMIGVIQIMASLDLGRMGGFIVVAAGPVIVNAGHLLLSPVHILEPALLINALAAQLRGRYALALLLVTVAAFVKPSLAYVYGLLLVVQIVGGWLPGTVPPMKQRLCWMLPALGAAALLTLAVVGYFGWRPFLATQIPLNASKAYADFKFGFFHGVGRKLWWPEPWTPIHYFLTIAGAWILASIVLLIGTVVSLRYWRTPVGQFIATCGILHLVFVCVFFGNEWSWIYYSYLPFMGAAVAIDQAFKSTYTFIRSIAALLVYFFVGQLLFLVIFFWAMLQGLDLWKTSARNPQMHGLYANEESTRAWAEVLELAKSRRVFVLNRTSGVHIFSPPVDGPRVWVLIRAVAAPGEIERIQRQLAAADVIVRPNWHDNDLFEWPEFAHLLQEFRLYREYNCLDIYLRRSETSKR